MQACCRSVWPRLVLAEAEVGAAFWQVDVGDGLALRGEDAHAVTNMLNAARNAQAMNAPGFGLHALKGNLKGHWSVTVTGNWRMTFRFENEDAVLVDYQDYH